MHTSDPQLAGALREHLGDLVSDLAGRGYRAETWQPLGGSATDGVGPRAGSAAPDSSTGQDLSGQAGGGSREGGSPAGQHQQQQRNGQEPDQPSWLEALARSTVKTGSVPYDFTH